MPKIISIYSEKGGVGKTTTTMNLAAAFGQMDKRILAIDAHLPGNLTCCLLPLDMQNENKTKVYPSKRESLDDFIYESTVHNVDIISAKDFTDIVLHLDISYTNGGLQRALESSNLKKYDYILIDTPSNGLISGNILFALDTMIILVGSSFCIDILPDMLDKIEVLNESLCKACNGYVLITFFNPNTEEGKQILKVRDDFEDYVLGTEIPMDLTLRDCASCNESIFTYETNCKSALAYMALAEELIRKLENDNESNNNEKNDFNIMKNRRVDQVKQKSLGIE